MGFNYAQTNKDIAPQFKITSAASWKEERVFIKPNDVTEVVFTDFNPNMFMLLNNTEMELKISMSNYPTPDNFDRLISPHTIRNFGQPRAINILYILNETGISGYIKLWRMYGEFDISVNQSTDITLPDIYIEGQGIVKGFGNGVTIPNMAQLEDIKSSMAEIKEAIEGMKKNVYVRRYEAVFTKNNPFGWSAKGKYKRLVHVINRGSCDLDVKFTQLINGVNEYTTFTLKPHEQLTDINLTATRFELKTYSNDYQSAEIVLEDEV